MHKINMVDGEQYPMQVNGVPVTVACNNVPADGRNRITIAVETPTYEAHVLGLNAELMFWENPHPEPDEEALIVEQKEPDAPAADSLIDLTGRVAGIIKKSYFIHTRNEQKAYDTALLVLEEVQRTYEQLAERAGLANS